MVKTHFFMSRLVMAAVGSVAAVSLIVPQVGAADFPQKGKAIQMLVGFAAGGSSDAGARILASGYGEGTRHIRGGRQQAGRQRTDRIHGTDPEPNLTAIPS